MGKFSPWKGGDVDTEGQGPVDTAGAVLVDNGATPVAALSLFLTADLDVAGYRLLKVFGQIGNPTTPAAASADCNHWIYALLPDGVTPFTLAPATVRSATSIGNGVGYRINEYDVSGYSRVRVQFQNANATSALQGAKLSYFLST